MQLPSWNTQHVLITYRQNLGGDVVWCSNSSCTVDLAVGIHLEAGSKVSQTDMSIFVNENVVRFYVPVDGNEKSCD